MKVDWSFTAHRGPPEEGDQIELRPAEPVRSRRGQTILAFCLSINEARALGHELLKLAEGLGDEEPEK